MLREVQNGQSTSARWAFQLSRKPDAGRPAGDQAIRRCAGRRHGCRGQACEGREHVAVAVAGKPAAAVLVGRCWISGAASSTASRRRRVGREPRGDRRFKDEAWSHSPFYELLKQSYLLGSKQLTDFVDQAQVDDKSKLQLRFYARQFIDAMSPSNFPATNPEVIRTAIQTRSAESGGRDAEPDRGFAEGAHHAGG